MIPPPSAAPLLGQRLQADRLAVEVTTDRAGSCVHCDRTAADGVALVERLLPDGATRVLRCSARHSAACDTLAWRLADGGTTVDLR